jgi:hypothetical protein
VNYVTKAKTKICLSDANPMTTVLSVEVFDGGELRASRSVLCILRKIPGFLSTESRVIAGAEWTNTGKAKGD